MDLDRVHRHFSRPPHLSWLAAHRKRSHVDCRPARQPDALDVPHPHVDVSLPGIKKCAGEISRRAQRRAYRLRIGPCRSPSSRTRGRQVRPGGRSDGESGTPRRTRRVQPRVGPPERHAATGVELKRKTLGRNQHRGPGAARTRDRHAGARQRDRRGHRGSNCRCAKASSAAGSASELRLATRSGGSPGRIRLIGISSFLPVSVRGIAGTVRSGPGRGGARAGRGVGGDPSLKGVVDGDAVGGDDEQEQGAVAAAGVLEVDDERIEDLREVFDHRVELAGPEANAAAIQGRVRTPGEDATAAFGEHDPVAVAPDAWVTVEVGAPVAAAVRRHPTGGPASRASAAVITSSPSLPTTTLPSASNALASTPGEGPDLALPDRLGEAAADEAGAHVGAARPVEQHRCGLHVLVDRSGSPPGAAASPPCRGSGSSSGQAPSPASGRPCDRPSGTGG